MGVTVRFQSSGAVPGNGAPVRMRGSSLTIGRAEENDIVLPSGDGTISRRHCVIEDQSGGVVLVDLSTNGTFLNYSKAPVGRTPTPVNNGDILSMGPYEMIVEINDELDIPDPLGEGPISHGMAAAAGTESLLDAGTPGEADFLDDLLGAQATPKGPGRYIPEQFEDGLLPPLGDDADPLLPTSKIPEDFDIGASEYDHAPATQHAFTTPTGSVTAIPDDWDDEFLKPVAPEASPELQPVPPTENTVAPGHPPAPPPPVPQREDLAFRAFLEGAGASHMDVPVEDMPMLMAKIGAAYRELVEGTREVLMTRSSIKGEFRINQTTLGAGKNNPLKFSMTADKALEAMVKPPEKGYLDADDAAHQAMRDIKAHEVAMVSGMEAALKGVLARLNPEKLAAKIESGGGLGALLKGKKARYWEVYETMYAKISEEAEEDFHELFAKEFARAYQAQLDRLK